AYQKTPAYKVKNYATHTKLDYNPPLSLRFNGNELEILEWGEVKGDKIFALNPFNLSNPKELILESKDYTINLNTLPIIISPREKYRLTILNTHNSNIATITNTNTQNIINPEIFIDDDFCKLIHILQQYKSQYKVSVVRLEVGYGERKSEIDLRGKRTPNGGVVEWISQFDNGGGTACFDTCKKILVNSGLSSNSASPITRFQVAKENKKLLQSTNQSEYLVVDVQTAKDGIAYLDSELESGYPVLVGVDYEFDRKIKLKNGKIDYPNKTDYTTDHYIVIVGRRYDEKNLYYLFYDVGTNSINEKQYKAGSNDNNRLFLQNDYSLRGQSQIPSKHFYVVTQIRRNIR
uniref:TIGR02594 family protein n=1 Tax=Helicobacter rappini TaxID=95150 RepID=UPI000CF0DEE0